MTQQTIRRAAMFLFLVVAGAAVRWSFRDLPNFAPVAAIALFAGFYFRSLAVAAIVPLLIMAATDWFIGGYDSRIMATVYGSLAAPVLCRGVLRRWIRAAATGDARKRFWPATGVAACGLASSLFFFLATNFAVWACYDIYSRDAAGLFACYAAALPFFRYTLLGDACFGAILFGGHFAYGWAGTPREVAKLAVVKD